MVKIKTVCIVSGTAINMMCNGLLNITSVWDAKIRTRVSNKPIVVALSNLCREGYKMQFKEFVQKLSSALRGGASTDKFTRALFEAILTDDGQDILDGYQTSSYKGFYNGNTSITGIAKKINTYQHQIY